MPLDHDALRADLVRQLGRVGPTGAPALCAALGVSQPSLSRLIRGAGPDVLIAGRARATRYAARRAIDGLRAPLPVYEIRAPGERPRRLLELHPVRPDGFYVEPAAGPGGFTPDLPWFLHGARPSGFLGRLLPRRFPELGLPADILQWRPDHALRYAAVHGWNLPGALVIGDQAYEAYTRYADDPPDRVAIAARCERYPELAADALAVGPAGSSAGGEQPKFLATRDDGPGLVPVLVKFSPPVRDEPSTRAADLLVAEHVAHEVLAEHGRVAARSSLLRAGGRVFLEVERFDRCGPAHRRGLVSLGVADAEWVGSARDRWSTTTAALLGLGRLDAAAHREARWQEVFGALIANTDMHPANLSLWLDGTDLAGLAPAYDMLPMLYAPRAGEVVPAAFAPQVPAASDADVARPAWAAAVAFWAAVALREDVSAGFRAIAAANRAALEGLDRALDRLPI